MDGGPGHAAPGRLVAHSVTLVRGRSSPDPVLPGLNRECQARRADGARLADRFGRGDQMRGPV